MRLSHRYRLSEISAEHKIYSIAKSAMVKDSNQDACAVSRNKRYYAIADGVGEGVFSDIWANMVVQYFCESPIKIGRPNQYNLSLEDDVTIRRWLSPIRSRMAKKVRLSIKGMSILIQDKWRDKGTGCTFLGLKFFNRKFRAYSVGDCNLFHIRGQELLHSFPLKSSKDFGSVPEQISTKFSQRNIDLNFVAFEYTIGDVLILATDAISQWLLAEYERGQPQWNLILNIRDHQFFEEIINDLRHRPRNRLHDDDVTVLTIIIH